MNNFSYSFWTGLQMIFFSKLASYHSLGVRNFPPKKTPKFLKRNFFDRIASKFAGMLELPPTIYMKNLVMIYLVWTLRTEFSNRTHILSRLQRTNLPSRKPRHDCNLFDIGCETSLYQLISVCIKISVRIFVSCFVGVKKNVKKYENFMIFVIFVIFNWGVPCLKNFQMSWKLGSIPFYDVSAEFSPAFLKFETWRKNKHFWPTLLLTHTHIIDTYPGRSPRHAIQESDCR